MKLLVTGGLGFIGSSFVLNTLEKNKDFHIINVDAELFGSNKKSLKSLKNSKNYQFIKGNICDFNLMNKLIQKCDSIINFAAESFVDRSIANAQPFLESNVHGVFNLLEIIRKFKKRFLHISTDEVFGSLARGSATEHSRFNPSSPYAATKAAAELLINSYNTTYDCDCLITRCTNNYGPRQFPEKLIPKTILLAKQNQKIPVYGSGKNIRDWIYVDDHCEAIFKVLTKGKSSSSYNISADNELDNMTIVKKILSIMDKSEDLVTFVEDRPGHDFRYSLNSSKIRQELRWKPRTNFKNGLEKTVDWYMANSDWWKSLVKTTMNKTPWKN
jgi:dTDP-glucose 4,6-dehydratase